jgi:hypothetical protein
MIALSASEGRFVTSAVVLLAPHLCLVSVPRRETENKPRGREGVAGEEGSPFMSLGLCAGGGLELDEDVVTSFFLSAVAFVDLPRNLENIACLAAESMSVLQKTPNQSALSLHAARTSSSSKHGCQVDKQRKQMGKSIAPH